MLPGCADAPPQDKSDIERKVQLTTAEIIAQAPPGVRLNVKRDVAVRIGYPQWEANKVLYRAVLTRTSGEKIWSGPLTILDRLQKVDLPWGLKEVDVTISSFGGKSKTTRVSIINEQLDLRFLGGVK
jgi:hypothetical protein